MISRRGLLLFASLLALAGCQDRVRFLRIPLEPLPFGTVRLQIAAAFAGKEAPPVFLSVSELEEQSFALAIPETGSGWLSVTVAARSIADFDLAVGVGVLPVAFTDEVFDTEALSLLRILSPTQDIQHSAGMLFIDAYNPGTVGCDPDENPDCTAAESPPRIIQLPSYRLDAFEVSIGEYADCVIAGACSPATQYPALPLTPHSAQNGVTWDQADAFCRWRGKRLPTEAEWELAARGFYGKTYPWGETPPSCDLASFSVNGTIESACPPPYGIFLQVDAYPYGRSDFGVYNTAGNVSEWVADYYAPRADIDDPERGPDGSPGDDKVVKGGSILTPPAHIRSSIRAPAPPSTTLDTLGFRCARDR